MTLLRIRRRIRISCIRIWGLLFTGSCFYSISRNPSFAADQEEKEEDEDGKEIS